MPSTISPEQLWTFVGRRDVFAQQHGDGSYRPAKRPLTEEDLAEHLAGFWSLGSYVIDPTNDTVRFVVFDLDTYDETARDFLTNAVAELVEFNHLRCLLLESSGGKGSHIWLFFSEPVSARQARFYALPVKESYDAANEAQGGSWPFLEVFPKQDEVPDGGYGNLVKLPLGIHAKSGNRSEILDHYGAGSLDNVQGLPVELLPPVPADWGRAKHGSEGRTAPFACISKLIEEGAPQGIRDAALFHFAHYAFGTGLPEDLVHEWTERVNTQFQPPMTDAEVDTKVQSASGMASPHPGCGADWLKGFCPGGENCFAPWNNDRPGRKVRVEEQSEELDRERWLAQRRNQ